MTGPTRLRTLSLAFLALVGSACSGDDPAPKPDPGSPGPPPDTLTYQIQDTYPHNDSLFTEGLLYEGGYLYEGTGLLANSTLRQIEIATGNTLLRHNLASSYFGEGIALANGTIVQLTWTTLRAFRYQLADFAVVDTLSYPTVGWGITYDGVNYVMSTGSDTLHFRSTVDFSEVGRVAVKDRGRPILYLNELEYIQGEIYANIFETDSIAVITPTTGRVRAWLDCTGIISPADRGANPDNVLNGIAYDVAGDRLFLTGKRWKKLFHVDLTQL